MLVAIGNRVTMDMLSSDGTLRVAVAGPKRKRVAVKEQWTHSEVSIFPRTTERSTGIQTDPNRGVVLNSLTILFRPENEVPAPGGVVSVLAPRGFNWHSVVC